MTAKSYTAPDRLTSYVAYEREGISSPDADGQPIMVRPQVYVREFPSVLVSKTVTKEQGSGEDRFSTTHFTFDAASAGVPGYRNDFGALLRPDSPGHDLLMEAHRRKAPVTVVIETRRKRRDDAGNAIDPCTPIHELRGATKPGGRKGDPARTLATCINLIAGVGPAGHDDSFELTSEVSTDPAEWAVLRVNTDGQFAPPGWRVVQGGVTPADGHATAAAPVTDHAESADAAALLAAKQRPVIEWAGRKLTAVGAIENLIADSVRLAEVVLWCADKVHQRTVGESAAPRLEKSHGESLRWVQSVIDMYSVADTSCQFTPDLLVPENRGRGVAWAERVVAVAVEYQTAVLTSVESYLTRDAGAAPLTTAPGPAAATPGRPTAVAADADATDAGAGAVLGEWRSFLTRVVAWADDHPDRFHPWLLATFNTADLDTIDPAALSEVIARYDQTRQTRLTFYEAVKDAHNAATSTPQRKAS